MVEKPIVLKDVFKLYRIGAIPSIWFPTGRFFRRGPSLSRAPEGLALWALRDISLEVEKGEALGVIGPNGAGKSTLLKILCGVTEQTRGDLVVKGRMAPLIEISAGLHPEMTGRENIWLNASLMGMGRAEIRRKFEEIVSFAELEPFIDTPVKRYSSGMMVRLGFSVAVHVEPDILLVDEVLSVGDARFRSKSIERMRTFKENTATTIVFVSHNMSAVAAMCDRVVWLDKGRIQRIGRPEEVIAAYLDRTEVEHLEDQKEKLLEREKGDRDKEGDLLIRKVELFNSRGKKTDEFRYRDDLWVKVYFHTLKPIPKPYFIVLVRSSEGKVFTANMLLDGNHACPEILPQEGSFKVLFKSLPLLPGIYSISVSAKEKSGMANILRGHPGGFFRVVGTARDYGMNTPLSDALLASREVAPVVIEHEWHFP